MEERHRRVRYLVRMRIRINVCGMPNLRTVHKTGCLRINLIKIQLAAYLYRFLVRVSEFSENTISRQEEI
jgi:hypothetical protein